MDIQALWIFALSIATPIAGVVGFSIQLRQVKKARLENEKLQLEIHALKERASCAEQRIVKVTTDQVMQFADVPRFSRGLESRASPAGGPGEPLFPPSYKSSLKEKLLTVVFFSALALLVAYFVYDLYRLAIWVLAKL